MRVFITSVEKSCGKIMWVFSTEEKSWRKIMRAFITTEENSGKENNECVCY